MTLRTVNPSYTNLVHEHDSKNQSTYNPIVIMPTIEKIFNFNIYMKVVLMIFPTVKKALSFVVWENFELYSWGKGCR